MAFGAVVVGRGMHIFMPRWGTTGAWCSKQGGVCSYGDRILYHVYHHNTFHIVCEVPSMSAPLFHMIAGAPDPVAPFSHAVEQDGWVFVTGQLPFTGLANEAP